MLGHSTCETETVGLNLGFSSLVHVSVKSRNLSLAVNGMLNPNSTTVLIFNLFSCLLLFTAKPMF